MGFLKKCQPIWSSRLAAIGNIIYECLVLLYISRLNGVEVPEVYPWNCSPMTEVFSQLQTLLGINQLNTLLQLKSIIVFKGLISS